MADLFIAPQDLLTLGLSPEAPRIFDLRLPEDTDDRCLPGALAATLADVETGSLPDRPIVCSCHRGGKISQLAVALLRARGAEAVALRGGHLAWVAAGCPTMAIGSLPARWVMPLAPKWSDLATLWLLRRVLAPTASVLAVERAWLSAAAEVRGASVLPAKPEILATQADLIHPVVSRLSGGPEALLSGRIARIPDPEAALTLIDDWLARPEVAA